MELQKQNNSIQQAKKTSLGQLLISGSNAEKVKYIGTLNMNQLLTNKERALELQDDIRRLKAKYQAAIELGDKKDAKFLATKGKELKAELQKIDVKPTIKSLQMQDEDLLIEQLTRLILDLDDAFNMDKKLSVGQIEHLAYTICQRMSSLSLEDIALCFHKAKCGDYGKVFERLDLNVINSWLNAYAKDRKDLHMQQMQNTYLANKQGAGYAIGDTASVNRVSQDRGIKTEDDAHFQEYRREVLGLNKTAKTKAEKG